MRNYLPILAVTFLLSSEAIVAAQSPQTACKKDISTFCATVEKGEGRVIKCLQENIDTISEECRSSLSNMTTNQQQPSSSQNKKGSQLSNCRSDITLYCSDVEKGEGRVLKCLKENKEKISDECNNALKELTGHNRPNNSQ